MSRPAAPPANRKPAHGNSVKFVRSPAGLTYHCVPHRGVHSPMPLGGRAASTWRKAVARGRKGDPDGRTVAREPPNKTGGSNRWSHDVEDVDPKERDGRCARTDDERLKAKQERKDEKLQPRRTSQRGAWMPFRRKASQRQAPTHAGKQQEQRGAEAAADQDAAKGVGRTRRRAAVQASKVWART